MRVGDPLAVEERLHEVAAPGADTESGGHERCDAVPITAVPTLAPTSWAVSLSAAPMEVRLLGIAPMTPRS